MSSLSFENIDRWLFEYTEGNLSPEQVGQLKQFLVQHPELQLDLDAWKSSRVSPEMETAINVAAFQKSVNAWPVISTLLIAFIGLGSFFYFYDFSVDQKYAQKTIDLDLIYGGDDFEFKASPIVSVNENDASSSISNLTSINPSTLLDSPLEGKVNSGIGSEKGDLIEKVTALVSNQGSPKNNSMKSALLQPESSANVSVQTDVANWLFEAPELERVKSSLSATMESNDIALAPSEVKFSSSKSKSSFSKKAKLVLRKVQRMMDQPVALRNFKDPHYAIPNLTAFQANFGMAGTMIQNRFQATSRNQWVGRENQQLMNRFSWDGYMHALRGGMGVDLTYNNFQDGSIRDMTFGLTYSPKLSLSRNVSFEPAVRFKMGMTEVDLNSSVIGSTIEMNRRNAVSMFENEQTPLGSQLWYRDVGVGALVNTKWFYAGLNLDNLGRHYNNFYSSDLSQTYEAALDFSAVFGTEYKSMNKDITLSTYFYYHNFGQINEVWGGANVRWRNIQVGAAVSNNADLGGTAGVVFDRFTVHYNLDYLTSVVLDERLLSHQVTMRMLLKPNRLAKKFLNM